MSLFTLDVMPLIVLSITKFVFFLKSNQQNFVYSSFKNKCILLLLLVINRTCVLLSMDSVFSLVD